MIFGQFLLLHSVLSGVFTQLMFEDEETGSNKKYGHQFLQIFNERTNSKQPKPFLGSVW